MNEMLFDKVKDYFNGKMSREEQLLFESELKTNKELAVVFDLYQDIENGIFDREENAEEEVLLRESLKKLHEQYLKDELQQDAGQFSEDQKQNTPIVKLPEVSAPAEIPISGEEEGKVRRMKIWRSLAIAAISIGIILTGSIWYLHKKNDSQVVASRNDRTNKSDHTVIPDTLHLQQNIPDDNTAGQNQHTIIQQKDDSIQLARVAVPTKAEREKLYTENFKPDAIPSDFSVLLDEALNHFKEQEYKEVIAAIDVDAIQRSIEELRPRGQPDEKQENKEKQTLFYAHYYKALSYMGSNNADKAIPEFQNALKKSTDRYWQAKAQWYLALAFLRTGKVREAGIWLKKVANTDKTGEYKQRALKLISELDGDK